METPATCDHCAHELFRHVSKRQELWANVRARPRRLVASARRHIRRDGWVATARFTLARVGLVKRPAKVARTIEGECLGLKPGELVEVKSRAEIEATLDDCQLTKGLYFQEEMWDFVGQRFRVFKRVDKYVVEATMQTRPIKNTVLLEGVFCDGSHHDGCAANCYHFWREAWLRRVDEGEPSEGAGAV